MKAVILAAGRGSRMRHLTDNRPKGLTPLHGVPLIERQCSALREGGVSEVGIVTGYMADRFDGYADRYFHNQRWAETQMVASLATAAEWLREGPVIVSYSDIFYTAAAVRALQRAQSDIAITYDPDWERQWAGRFDDPLDDAETFRFQADNEDRHILTEIGNKPRTLAEVQGQYMGLLRFTPPGWAAIERARARLAAGERDALSMTALLGLLIAQGERIEAVSTFDPWGEIDSVEDLEFFERSAPPDV